MKFTLILATLVAFFGAVSALPSEKRQETGECQLGVRQLYAPDEVTPGVPFHVKYCSSAYFKLSSYSLILTVSRNETDYDGAVVVAQRNYLTDGYEWDVTLQTGPISGGVGFVENSWFKVIEVIRDYMTPYSMGTFTKPVTITYADSSEHV